MAQAKKAPQKKAPLSRTQVFTIIMVSLAVGIGAGFDAGYHGSVDLGGVILGVPVGIFRVGGIWSLILIVVAALAAWLLAGKRRKPRQKRQSLRERIHNWTSDRSAEDEPEAAPAAPEESEEDSDEEEAPATPATPAPAPATPPTPAATTVMPATPAPAAAPAAPDPDETLHATILKMALDSAPTGVDKKVFEAGFRQGRAGHNVPLSGDAKTEADRKAGFDAASRIYHHEEKK